MKWKAGLRRLEGDAEQQGSFDQIKILHKYMDFVKQDSVHSENLSLKLVNDMAKYLPSLKTVVFFC